LLFLVLAYQKESDMTQSELDREVARVTGESLRTVSSLGFIPLTAKPYEMDCDHPAD
jgi:hypothetical protein